MIVISLAVAITKFLFGIRSFAVDSNVDNDFSLVQGILHVCGHVHVRLDVSPGIDCTLYLETCYVRWRLISTLFDFQFIVYCMLASDFL